MYFEVASRVLLRACVLKLQHNVPLHHGLYRHDDFHNKSFGSFFLRLLCINLFITEHPFAVIWLWIFPSTCRSHDDNRMKLVHLKAVSVEHLMGLRWEGHVLGRVLATWYNDLGTW